MADETEQKLDAPKIRPTSDALTRPSVIRTKEDEAIWDEMQKPHKLGKHESATHIGLSPEVIAEMQKKGQGSKLELFDSKADEALAVVQKLATEQVLIASNISPNVPNLEQLQQYQEIQSDSDVQNTDAKLAKNLREHALGTDIVRVAVPSGAGDRALFPYRGSENMRLSDCTKQNPQAWEEALNAYPKLREYLSTPDGARLMKALVRNELHWYDPKDALGDGMARAGKPDYTETLGYAQITPKGIHEFETGVINGQQVLKPDPQLSEFLAGKGYSGAGHEAKALEDPSCVPMILAAKLNTLVHVYEKSGTPINARTLAYGYNADVYYNPSKPGSYHAAAYPGADSVEKRLGNLKAFPIISEDVLKTSIHLRNVESQMSKIH